MANTYSQLYVQIVFAVKGRQNLISKKWKDEIYKYITGIITNQKQKLIAINGMPDHIHILVGIKPNIPLSDLVRDIKSSSSKFINEQKWINGKFEWQTGFGAFSYGHSQLTNVIKYIENQEEHHRTKTFKEEYMAFLKLFNIDFRNEYLFEDI
ncbi:IS200/IS605 family transposase [Flavobacterium fluviale]|uniref:IS200/IS605 family transposase n=1 Tax=Flavobacterium fluviale TaxID=2249356 RepID=A0A344LPL4_9FLAO|nr:IS200/IS605 family transposase [Flavobacterium fluviale]AXB55856.1 IS200/IS605 family transposase [Flavobacterium fluviale]